MQQSITNDTSRLEAFSDGVFSIAITILAFNLRVPSREAVAQTSLAQELLAQWPTYLAFFGAFAFILVMWLNHHRLFTLIQRSDTILILINGLLLLGVVIVPFMASLIAEYLQTPDNVLALAIFHGSFFIIALIFNLLWSYAAYSNHLFDGGADPQLVQHIKRQYAAGPFLYLVAFVFVFVNATLSLFISLLIAIFFAIPNENVQKLMDEQHAEG